MNKRVHFIAVFMIFYVFNSFSQASFTVTPSDTIRLDTTQSSCQTMDILTQYIQNTSSDTIQLGWRVVYNTFPHSWAVSYCYPGVCLSSSAIGTHTFHFNMLPHDTGSMELELTPVSGGNSGHYQVLLWATSDSANTVKVLNYKATINSCNVGISEAEISQIYLYPNPARNLLKVNLPQNLQNGQIDIFDLIGSRVLGQSITSTKDIDLSTLETGIYVARIYENGKLITTKKFTKVN